jgi:hypothetical protein
MYSICSAHYLFFFLSRIYHRGACVDKGFDIKKALLHHCSNLYLQPQQTFRTREQVSTWCPLIFLIKHFIFFSLSNTSRFFDTGHGRK